MAKYTPVPTDHRFTCRQCRAQHLVEIDQPSELDSWGTPKTVTITRMCDCMRRLQSGQPFYGSIDTTKAKEIKPVAKQFDTTEVKNTALNTIVSKVEAVERALFNRAHARAKLEAEHSSLIAEASINLDRVLMEALQAGLDSDDYATHLPEYEDDLTERVANLIELSQLANVDASV